MVQRHKSISGRGSLPGAGGEAAAAAAAAAATAASAVAYTQISSKLEGIEGLISALKVHVRPGCVLCSWAYRMLRFIYMYTGRRVLSMHCLGVLYSVKCGEGCVVLMEVVK